MTLAIKAHTTDQYFRQQIIPFECRVWMVAFTIVPAPILIPGGHIIAALCICHDRNIDRGVIPGLIGILDIILEIIGIIDHIG